MKNFEYREIVGLIRQSKLIVVTSHHNPDGDAIGSVLAMTALLNKAGNKAVGIVPNAYPSFLQWMPGSDEILVYQSDEKAATATIAEADLVFCLDYNALHRTGGMQQALRNARGKKILIDHHLEPVLTDFDYYLSVVPVSSTAELVYRFFEGCSWLHLVDQYVATGLFVGIMTDTGSFSFSCNYPDTFKVTAALLETGINAEVIHRHVYDTYSENRLRLLGYCLSRKLTILPEVSTAYIALSREELDQFKYQEGDTEGIVNYALSIDQIKVAIFMTERTDRIRISFRSKGDFSVNKIARDHFAGGGHKNAAGGDSFSGMDATINKIKEVILQYKDEIDRSSSL